MQKSTIRKWDWTNEGGREGERECEIKKGSWKSGTREKDIIVRGMAREILMHDWQRREITKKQKKEWKLSKIREKRNGKQIRSKEWGKTEKGKCVRGKKNSEKEKKSQ